MTIEEKNSSCHWNTGKRSGHRPPERLLNRGSNCSARMIPSKREIRVSTKDSTTNCARHLPSDVHPSHSSCQNRLTRFSAVPMADHHIVETGDQQDQTQQCWKEYTGNSYSPWPYELPDILSSQGEVPVWHEMVREIMLSLP